MDKCDFRFIYLETGHFYQSCEEFPHILDKKSYILLINSIENTAIGHKRKNSSNVALVEKPEMSHRQSGKF